MGRPVNGTAAFQVTSDKPGTIFVTVTGYGKRPYEGSLSVKPASGLYISSPLTGAKLTGQLEQKITWQSFDNFSQVNLSYSLDNGVTFQEIASGIANKGFYNWTLL